MPTHPGSQLIHYAKGRFHRGELFRDLQTLVGNYTAVRPQYVSYDDILGVLCDVALPFLFDHPNPQRYLADIMVRLGAIEARGKLADLIALELLSILKLMRVRDGERVLVELEEPNYNLLPLSADDS